MGVAGLTKESLLKDRGLDPWVDMVMSFKTIFDASAVFDMV